jgi:uncharacterized integral membrane protein
VFRKVVTALIIVPLGVFIIVFAVANRQAVTLSFDPFSANSPAYALTVPLFVLIFIVLILGVIIGGAAAWLGQSPWRRTARKLDADVRALHDELAEIRHRFGTQVPQSPHEAGSMPINAPPAV